MPHVWVMISLLLLDFLPQCNMCMWLFAGWAGFCRDVPVAPQQAAVQHQDGGMDDHAERRRAQLHWRSGHRRLLHRVSVHRRQHVHRHRVWRVSARARSDFCPFFFSSFQLILGFQSCDRWGRNFQFFIFRWVQNYITMESQELSKLEINE